MFRIAREPGRGVLFVPESAPKFTSLVARDFGETGMTELANWVAGSPSPMPTNYNAVAGYGFNPYDPRRDPREATGDGRPALMTGGSSSGIGTAASFWAGNVGTVTSGSILSPANRTCWRRSSRRWAASAATASSRSRAP